MQGKKTYTEKLFTSFQLSDRVPATNFYRRLKENIDFTFLSKETQKYYGKCGQKSIDPVVFFKLMLVSYLENITSDRKLIDACSLRLDVLYFLDHDIDDSLPWHSTLSRTRQLYEAEVFEMLFNKVFSLCVEKGMVTGHTQAIDSAYIKANASMDSLEVKQPEQNLEDFIAKTQTENSEPIRKAKNDKSSNEERTLSIKENELKELEYRYKYQSIKNHDRPGSGDERAQYLSNKTHYSPTDPDAKIAVKPGKPRQLNYLCSMAVDTSSHVITHIQADLAHRKDSNYLIDIVDKTKGRLNENYLSLVNVLADTGYSNGTNYQYLEKENLRGWIPVFGQFKNERDGFTYVEEGDYFLCRNNKKVAYKKTFTDQEGRLLKRYITTRQDCKECPFRENCIGKNHEKSFQITAHHKEYQRAYYRQKSKEGKYRKKQRHSTVEPVLGSLINYTGLRKINVKGQEGAHKAMTVAAIAYNLKKYMKTLIANKLRRVLAIAKNKRMNPLESLQSIILLPNFYLKPN